MIRMTPIIAMLSLLAVALADASFVAAQQYPPIDGRQFPLNQMSPPGMSAQWSTNIGRAKPAHFQPVRVILPAAGSVTFYESANRPIELAAPAQAGLLVGNVYRLKVSGLEDFPGNDFYPSIELIDRLHPPTGREEDFPIDFEFTTEEFEWAANGRLVTKVIYLEQPERVPTLLLDSAQRIQTIEPSRNALAEADSLGRPMAIVRLGGRTPDPLRPDPQFFGPGGPIRVVTKPAQAASKMKRPAVQQVSHRQAAR
ncbi:MAG: hypothetical protein H7062_02890 [Candidatus Saccharimonas sp.]|nr:hypothetical protein [Planctomycetaceae bacterium]